MSDLSAEYAAERRAVTDEALARYQAIVARYMQALSRVDAEFIPQLRASHGEMITALAVLDKRWVDSGKLFGASLSEDVTAPSAGSAEP